MSLSIHITLFQLIEKLTEKYYLINLYWNYKTSLICKRIFYFTITIILKQMKYRGWEGPVVIKYYILWCISFGRSNILRCCTHGLYHYRRRLFCGCNRCCFSRCWLFLQLGWENLFGIVQVGFHLLGFDNKL